VVVSVLSQWICLGGHGYFHPTPEDWRRSHATIYPLN
jgi:hypothetical protein